MRLLLVTTLYPNRHQPTRATYNRALVRAFRELGHDVRVIAPIPWCPIVDPVLRRRRLPPYEEEFETRVVHPRFFYTPGILIRYHHLFYRFGVRRVFRTITEDFRPDHVLLAFVFPDAAAMAPVCRTAGVPYSVMVLGSDFRIRSRQEPFREIVMQTLQDAPLIFCPGNALRADMIAAGIDGNRIVAFNNGVDRRVFHCQGIGRRAYGTGGKHVGKSGVEKSKVGTADSSTEDSMTDRVGIVSHAEAPSSQRGSRQAWLCDSRRQDASAESHNVSASRSARGGPLRSLRLREKISVSESPTGAFKTVLFVGNLVHVKGVDRLLRAIANVPEARLVVIGDGKQRRSLQDLARSLGIGNRVSWLGRLPQDEVADRMRRADCLCLPSRSEGMPNVVLEALACGTPVVATAVGEVPHIVQNGVNGYVVPTGDDETVSAELVRALDTCLRRSWSPQGISDTVRQYSWEEAARTMVGRLEPHNAEALSVDDPSVEERVGGESPDRI